MSEQFVLRGHLKGHNGWVTSICVSSSDDQVVLSSARDKSCLLWRIQQSASDAPEEDLALNGPSYGVPMRSLKGHSHIVQDLDLSMDGQFAITGSWDKTLRLWKVGTGVSDRTVVGHKDDVLSVAFSPDNLCIASGSRDRSIRVWNTVGECQMVFDQQGHTDWVSCVKFSPNPQERRIVSCGYDKLVKVWDMEKGKLLYNLVGHTGVVNAVAISPDGSLCASGGKDGLIILWDLNEGKKLYELPIDSNVNDVIFSPSRYWLAAATDAGIRVWDLESKEIVGTIVPSWPAKGAKSKGLTPSCTCICWSNDGNVLYSGYTDHIIRIWAVQA